MNIKFIIIESDIDTDSDIYDENDSLNPNGNLDNNEEEYYMEIEENENDWKLDN